ncbi:MAG: LssY C-terminal domain-containing protein [Planctomycetes bacterium]|nr:LssY C-terminal domain-containing protein [Planctomycetota bacterium]
MTSLLQRLLITPYAPEPGFCDFLARAETQESQVARVSVTVLDAAESARRFGVPLANHGVQPVHLRIENRTQVPLRLHAISLDPNYFTAVEAAALSHFSFARRLTAFGALGWLFLPLLGFAPAKLVSGALANRRMDECFRAAAFRLRPIPPGGVQDGFVFTTLEFGTKEVHVRLLGSGDTLPDAAAKAADGAAPEPDQASEFVFSIRVAGIASDHLGHDLAGRAGGEPGRACDLATLLAEIRALPPATTDRDGRGSGDPTNLVVIGDFDRVLGAFAGRWDETETITLATCWKTLRAFLLGSQYRYSPVSPLHLFGRSQDLALQRIRHSIHERLHLRLWLTPLRFRALPVWAGQVSRDIGVRFTTRTWNLTTHRIDPDVDESRDYVIEDLLHARRIEAAGYVGGVGECARSAPRHNLTGDPYYTDGKRAVVLLAAQRQEPRFMSWT